VSVARAFARSIVQVPATRPSTRKVAAMIPFLVVSDGRRAGSITRE